MPHNSARNQCSAKIPRMDRNDHQAPDQHRKHGDHQAGAEQSALLTDNRKDHIILRFRHKAKLLQAFSKPAAKDSPAAFFGKGIVINKFTGAGGKSGSNDANAEYVGALRAIFDDAKVNWQTAELGKVDVGGGGTIAYIMSLYGMEVIDSGVPVLSMHAPWEVTSKADVYEAKKAYVAFLKNA